MKLNPDPMKPYLEIRLIQSSPNAGWEYAARRSGELAAASDGDAVFARAANALSTCFDELGRAVDD